MPTYEFEFDVEDLNDDDGPQQWIWRNRIPRGLVTTFSGRWGVGKTRSISSLFKTILSQGEFPDGAISEQDPGKILIVTTETSNNQWTEMLKAQGCTPREINEVKFLPRLRHPVTGELKPFDLTYDLPALVKAIKVWRPIIILFDPLTEFISINEIVGREVRKIMLILTGLCREYKTSVWCTLHWNKNKDQSEDDRTAGSHQFVAAVQSAITVKIKSEKEDVMLFEQTKMNAGPMPTPRMLAFQIVEPGAVAWSRPLPTPPDSKLSQAGTWIRETLSKGPISVRDMHKLSNGLFTAITLNRARAQLGLDVLTIQHLDLTTNKEAYFWELLGPDNNWGAGQLSIASPHGSVSAREIAEELPDQETLQ